MVVGNRGTGKSFFCDKILNLSEIRGNHVKIRLFSFAARAIRASIYGRHLSKKMISKYSSLKSATAISTHRNSRYYQPTH